MEANRFYSLNIATVWETDREILRTIFRQFKKMTECAVALYGNGATMRSHTARRITEKPFIITVEIMGRAFMTVISAWTDWCIRIGHHIPDYWNIKMCIAR